MLGQRFDSLLGKIITKYKKVQKGQRFLWCTIGHPYHIPIEYHKKKERKHGNNVQYFLYMWSRRLQKFYCSEAINLIQQSFEIKMILGASASEWLWLSVLCMYILYSRRTTYCVHNKYFIVLRRYLWFFCP